MDAKAQLAFGRSWRVTAYWPSTKPTGSQSQFVETLANGVEITDLDVRFKIKKTLAKEPNSCELSIFNLNADTRARMQRMPLTVRIEAGYGGVLRHLFLGSLRFGGHTERKGVDAETKLQLLDGGRAFAHARFRNSYSAGTPYAQVVRDCAASLGLVLPKNIATDPALGATIPSSLAIEGVAAFELTKLLAQFGYSWSVQNGKLQTLRDGEASDTKALVVDRSSGIVEAPSYGAPSEKGEPPLLTCKMLLTPDVVPGMLVKMDVDDVQGLHRVKEVDCTADSRGNDWYTEFKAKVHSV